MALHLEDHRKPVADIYHAGILARPLDDARSGGGQCSQPSLRGFVGAGARSSMAEKMPSSVKTRLAPDQVEDALVLVRLQPVGGNHFVGDRNIGDVHGHRFTAGDRRGFAPNLLPGQAEEMPFWLRQADCPQAVPPVLHRAMSDRMRSPAGPSSKGAEGGEAPLRASACTTSRWASAVISISARSGSAACRNGNRVHWRSCSRERPGRRSQTSTDAPRSPRVPCCANAALLAGAGVATVAGGVDWQPCATIARRQQRACGETIQAAISSTLSKQSAPVAAAMRILDQVFGMRHDAEHIATIVDDAGDVVDRAVRVGGLRISGRRPAHRLRCGQASSASAKYLPS